MAISTQAAFPTGLSKTKSSLWLATVGVLATLLTLITMAARNEPVPTPDVRILNWISGWDLPGLTGFLEVVSFFTNSLPGLVLAMGGVGFLWLIGMSREAKAFAVIGAILGLVVFLGDATLGELVGRGRPFASANLHPSFPSGHVFGSTVLFGFWLFLAGYFGLKKKFLIPGIMLLVGFLLVVGLSRIHVEEHWPSDVLAGYLLGGVWLLVLIPAFVYLRKSSWFFPDNLEEVPTVVSCDGCRIEKSIASVVVLNPSEGTATKVYKPPPLVNILYWMAFQAKFPYTRNVMSLQTAAYRRRIAGLLTLHRFGKNLVAPAIAIGWENSYRTFVTEYVPGSKVENDRDVQKFLGEVTDLFAEAGLGVWQINPRNPHAHTNLIMTPDGDYKIIDLESAVVTVLPAKGQLRSALRSGNIPIFDDIDFLRLGEFINSNQGALTASLGADGLAELKDVSAVGEQLMRGWKASEPRIVGRIISRIYRLLDLSGAAEHIMVAVKGADDTAIDFLKGGIEQWEKEGRIEKEQARSLRNYLSSGAVNDAIHHMGAHMVLSVAIAIPIPGLRSLARFLWTLAFWTKSQLARFTRGERPPNIHNPLVMAIAILPIFGAFAYLAAKPLRRKILVRLMMDHTARKLPFNFYNRLNLVRWLPPTTLSAVSQYGEAGVPNPAR